MKPGQDADAAAVTDAEPAAEADSAPAAEPAPDRSSGAAAPAGAPGWAAAMALLLVLLIAGVTVAVSLLLQVRRADAASARRRAVVAAARAAVTDLTTADYRHPQRYLGRLRGDATGKFLSLLTNSATGFANVLAAGKVQTAGRVVAVGVQRAGPATAELTVVADVTVRNAQAPAGGRRVYRLRVSLIRAGGHWLVSNVDFVR